VGVTRIDRLTDEQRARFDEWADRWINVGLRTGPADRERFEAAVRDCYRFAGIPFPDIVVWVPSPLVMAFAAPAAAFAIELIEAQLRRGRGVSLGDGAVRGAVDGQVGVAVGGAVGGAVDGAVRGAVGAAVRGAVGAAVDAAVGAAVRGAVRGAVDDAVDRAVHGAVGVAVLTRATINAIAHSWRRYIGGQLWPGWYYGAAYTSFFREVCDLELPGDMWDRGRAYEATVESACWWWPHRRFVMVSERPTTIRRELVDEDRPRGWGSHRLHCDDGPAVAWPDGWGVWAIHGVRVSRQVVEAPDTLTAAQITGEANAEVRRVMIERFGADRYLRDAGAEKVHVDEYGALWRLDVPDDEALVMVQVTNSTPEPDGTFKDYWLRVPPNIRTARGAVAWTFGETARGYRPLVQT